MIITFFGSPGVGKTTHGTKLAYQALKKRKRGKRVYDYAYCNYEVSAPGVRQCNFKEIGKWTFPKRSLVVMDEAGIEFNNRFFKALPKEVIEYLKLLRHYYVDMIVLSQSWDDMDITIRRLSDQLWYMQRLGPWTITRRVYKFVTVDEETKQIIDGYQMASGLWLLVLPLQWFGIVPKHWGLTFRPFYYRWFDSWATPDTPVKDFA